VEEPVNWVAWGRQFVCYEPTVQPWSVSCLSVVLQPRKEGRGVLVWQEVGPAQKVATGQVVG